MFPLQEIDMARKIHVFSNILQKNKNKYNIKNHYRIEDLKI